MWLRQDCSACATQMARDWPLSKERVAHLAVQRETAPTKVRSTAGTVADRIRRMNAPS